MKKRILSILCALALCLSLLTVGISVAAEEIVYTPLQDFESDNIGSDCYTLSQFQGTNILTYSSVVGKGSGRSKKRAEQMAAKAAVEKLFPQKA